MADDDRRRGVAAPGTGRLGRPGPGRVTSIARALQIAGRRSGKTASRRPRSRRSCRCSSLRSRCFRRRTCVSYVRFLNVVEAENRGGARKRTAAREFIEAQRSAAWRAVFHSYPWRGHGVEDHTDSRDRGCHRGRRDRDRPRRSRRSRRRRDRVPRRLPGDRRQHPRRGRLRVCARIAKSQSIDELIERMDEASAVIGRTASDLDDAGVAEGFEDTNATLVTRLQAFSNAPLDVGAVPRTRPSARPSAASTA